MGIYWFAVDYSAQEQMWAPKKWSDRYPDYPGHPLPSMMAFANKRGSHFELVNDCSSYEEHSFLDVTEKIYDEWKKNWTDYDWATYEKFD